MPRIPAVCTSCGVVFASGLNVGGTVSYKNCQTGPCPRCGQRGDIPDGTYKAISNAVLAFATGVVGPPQLNHLLDVLNAARTNREEPEVVAKRIRSEVPELESIADVIPKTRKELYAFVAILIALIFGLLQTFKPEKNPRQLSEQQVQEIVDRTITEVDRKATTNAQTNPSNKKTGRNAPCPCASGKKYKHCCGKRIR